LLEIGLDRLFQEAALHPAPLFASSGKLPALEHRHLMGELVNLELLVLQLVLVTGNAFEQAGREFAQLLCVHRGKLVLH